MYGLYSSSKNKNSNRIRSLACILKQIKMKKKKNVI